MKGMMKMTTFEKVLVCFKGMQEGGLIPQGLDPNEYLKVYDKEEDLKPAWITNIFKDTNGDIGIEIHYIDDDTDRFYKLWEKTEATIPESNRCPEYRYDDPCQFDYSFITEERISKLMKKVWPDRFDDDDGDDLYLEYVETIDPNHANYKFFWLDGSSRENEYIVTLSKDDINELLTDSQRFMYDLQDAIKIMGLWPPKDEDEE